VIERVREPLEVTAPLRHIAELVREGQALVDRVGADDRRRPAVERPHEGGRTPRAPGQIERFLAQRVSPLPRMLVADRSGQARQEPSPQDVDPIAESVQALLEQRNEQRIGAGATPHMASAVACGCACQLAREIGAPRNRRCLEERLPCGGHIARARYGVAARQEQLAPGSLVVWVRELERLERRFIETSGLLVGQVLERAIASAPGVVDSLAELAPRHGMVRELGELRPRLGAVECFEGLDRLSVQPDPANRRQSFVQAVADQYMGESEAPGRTGHP
jgi:hypothetical protein